jgi:Sulfotransferase domain
MTMSRTSSGLQVIGAGFGRSGTTSLMSALGTLGYRRCYHMRVALTHYFHMKFWIRAKAGEAVDFRAFMGRYQATLDWPACDFYKELTAAFPDAKVLLNVRDPDQWYDSMVETIWAIQKVFPWWMPREIHKIHDDILWNSRFGGEFTNRAKAIAAYEAHLEDVRRNVPPGRLLEYDVKEGWKPLCDFLGKPVPANVPFPRLNDRVFFTRVMIALRIVEWLVPVLVVAAAAALVYSVT